MTDYSITEINISRQGLTELPEDIHLYTQLTKIDCSYNQLITLPDNLPSSLIELDCSNNQLTTLESISKCIHLQHIICWNNLLTNLDLSYFPNLNGLACGENQLTKLDLSFCPNLNGLNCCCNQITSLDLSQFIHLLYLNVCYNINLINLSSCSNLEVLIGVSTISLLDLREYPKLKYLWCSNVKSIIFPEEGCKYLEDLSIYNSQITSLNLSKFPLLKSFDCGYKNEITTLYLPENLKFLRCNNNKLLELDLSNCKTLVYVDCCNNQLMTLYLPEKLYELKCNNNRLTELDLSQCIKLKELKCDNNPFYNEYNFDINTNIQKYIECCANRFSPILK
jgi:hypothetical protein